MKEARWKAAFPGNFVPVLTLEGKCLHRRAKPAHLVRHLPRIATLRDEEKLQSWLYQIARNTIADYYREHQATVALSEALLIPEKLVVDDDVVKSLLPGVRAMMESLPDGYRQALLLTEYEGLTQRELAEWLGLSLSGAKSRVQSRISAKASCAEGAPFRMKPC